MSGPIRKTLGPGRARATTLIVKPLEKLDLTQFPTDQQRLDAVSGIRIKVNHDLDKLSNAVNLLVNKDNAWVQLIQSLPPDSAKQEETLYSAEIDKLDGHYNVIIRGQDKMSEMKSFLEELDMIASNLNTKLTAPVLSSVYSTAGSSPAAQTLKLPKIELPKFNGDPSNWKTFWDLFESSVHQQPINNVQKFAYLSSALQGPAASAISGLAITNDNYGVAVKLITDRFGKDSVVKNSLFSKLRNLRVSNNSTKDLRSTLDAMERVLRQLESLNENVEQTILIDLLRGKLPPETLLEMHKLLPIGAEWTVEHIRTTFRQIVESQEEIQRITQHQTAAKLGPQSQTIQPSVGQHSKPLYRQSQIFASKATAGSMAAGVNSQNHKQGSKSKFVSNQRGFNAQQDSHDSKRIQPCVFCGGDHYNANCTKFSSALSRKQQIMQKSYCLRCLRPDHKTNQCQTSRPCYYCKQMNHNCALCFKQFPSSSATANSAGFVQPETRAVKSLDTQVSVETNYAGQVVDKTVKTLSFDCVKTKSALLLTASTKLRNTDDTSITISAQLFFDIGSQRTFITDEFAKNLQLQSKGSEQLLVYTFGAQEPQYKQSNKVVFDVVLRDGHTISLDGNTVPHLTNQQTRNALALADQNFISQQFDEQFFADKLPFENLVFKPNVVIGQDYFWDFVSVSDKIRLPSGLYIIPSKLGLLLGGKQMVEPYPDNAAYPILVNTAVNQAVQELHTHVSADSAIIDSPNLADFWQLESIGIIDSPDIKDDDVALQQFNQSVQFFDGRYYVKWPYKPEIAELPDNKAMALQRFRYLSKRFFREPVLLPIYAGIISDQLKKGIIEIVNFPDATDGRKFHYLPHHPVITPQKTTTKTRIVYDASARKIGSLSLNDCLFRGQIILPDLAGLLLRFRLQPVGIVADIEKAFLQIGLQDADRDLTRFLWFKDPSVPCADEDKLQIYCFARVPFGIISSPFLLGATIKFHLSQIASDTAKLISDNIYVDNLICGVQSTEATLKLYSDGKDMFQLASMNLREWNSNSSAFNEKIPENDCVKNTSVKVMGLQWSTEFDLFSMKAPRIQEIAEPTKRSVLQTVASVFDPLGFVSPALLPGKLFLQQLWNKSLNWDDLLPSDLKCQWELILESLADLDQVQLQRFTGWRPDSETELHVFVDASSKAYAAVAYLRQEAANNCYRVEMIFSKARLAPKQTVTIPRLELLALLIGCRILQFLNLELHIPINRSFVWTDSECCLHWLTTSRPLGRFVENRLKEICKIQHELDMVTVRFVPTASNPADCATRGLTVKELLSNSLWWHGPPWLSTNDWPETNLPPVTPENLTSIKNEKSANPTCEAQIGALFVKIEDLLIDPSRFSNLSKLLNTTVYCFRFLKNKIWKRISLQSQKKYNFLSKLLNPICEKGPIKLPELNSAKLFWAFCTQRHYCADMVQAASNADLKKKKLLRDLGLKIDSDGLLRCHGRFQLSMLPEEQKFPILLPKKSPFTKLVILAAHSNSLHSGVQQTLAETRREFWIPQGRSVVRQVVRSCVTCRKIQGGPYSQPEMPPLPKERIHRAKPFQYVGLDYFGPIWHKTEIERKKAWVCLFTCLATRAVHLEVVIDLSAQQFLCVLRRFFARRGMPAKVVSDNAPQFKLTKDMIQNAWLQIGSF